VVQNTTNAELLEEFIRRYGDSFYASVARARLRELTESRSGEAASSGKPATSNAFAEVKPAEQNTAVAMGPVQSSSSTGGGCGGNIANVSLSSRAPCPLSATEERGLKPKDAFRECASCPEMVVVPIGRFTMGSLKGEEGRDYDEGTTARGDD